MLFIQSVDFLCIFVTFHSEPLFDIFAHQFAVELEPFKLFIGLVLQSFILSDGVVFVALEFRLQVSVFLLEVLLPF